MQTKQCYYDDPYKNELECKVISSEQNGKYFNVILDQTIFYPQGGGQPSDQGVINDFKVELVSIINGEIIHQVKGEIQKDHLVKTMLNWDRRYKFMRYHTAGHVIHDVLTGLIKGLVPIKANHSSNAYIQYHGVIDPSKKDEIEKAVNEAVAADYPVATKSANYEELVKECPDLASTLPKNKPLRAIKIGDFPVMADGGVHVKSTKEIGTIKITEIKSENDTSIVYYQL
ncbi:hypothetical protein A3C23_05680 [Candidatus Roizmanbacteria bacterium RIFCSPHIGHO2_02_FULL_37_13b]|uniref:Alanyl-transfer RNA synthetases family profile domain-containing protein n=1 Tax=Candidatus Roizmanbacteria bacterium RIFCSPLOWO2_02_FULL_36_11 TaxID=1802071 RepID=A0A1F7JCD5_9BACT|nr:MAG: hypothetical protein A3C23_05680 [Candidatus Roizmanbacteria bacterium RIFCSPHIGHO2_02_FULL_37_13b]OGK53270.1 MAG: hypothetical protein A3H78_03110 [Candidatus Roizmanbacteria bacterium RIFCSPLOWO2_02_FULL_36_11]